jgi:hypothetical protein
MTEEFSTVDITRLTPKEKILEMVGESARPSEMCETMPGYIHEKETQAIADKLNVDVAELKEHFLREVRAYNTTLHKPKHETNERHAGLKPTDVVEKRPHGKCVFHDKSKEGHRCMLGDAMPLHCRIAHEKHGEKLHAWYLLNHAVKADDPHSVREWAIYLKTHPTIPGGKLHELVPDREKLNDILNMQPQGGESHGKNDRN